MPLAAAGPVAAATAGFATLAARPLPVAELVAFEPLAVVAQASPLVADAAAHPAGLVLAAAVAGLLADAAALAVDVAVAPAVGAPVQPVPEPVVRVEARSW